MTRKNFKEKVFTEMAPNPIGSYSQGVICKCSQFLFVSGQLGINERGELEPTIKLQTKKALENMLNIAKAADFSIDDLIKITFFLKDIKKFNIVNEVYKEFLKEREFFPARSTIEVSALPLDALIEIEGVFCK